MNRKEKTIKQLQAECKERKIGFMTSWTKLALINRLDDEDSREKKLNELKKEVDDKSEILKTLDVGTQRDAKIKVQQDAITELKNQKKNELIQLEREWEQLTNKQDNLYKEAEKIGDRKKIINNQKRNLKVFIENL